MKLKHLFQLIKIITKKTQRFLVNNEIHGKRKTLPLILSLCFGGLLCVTHIKNNNN
jgi:hypothetical protein